MSVKDKFSTWLNNNKLTTPQISTSNNATVTATVSTANTVNTIWTGNSSNMLGQACVHGIAGNCAQCHTSLGGTVAIGSGGASGAGGWIGGTGIAGITVQTVQTYTPLTQQEQDELKMLEEQHAAETKALKKQKFRELHPELRQLVIATLLWNEKCGEISGAEANRSDRLTQLQTRKSPYLTTQGWGGTGQLIIGGGATTWGNLTYSSIASYIPVPAGLSVQDLQEAHTEATLEEELLSATESESK